jgi:predicted glutamine amidotransferase
MCRLLYFSGNKNQYEIVKNLIDALVKASEKDNTLPILKQHKDGFGDNTLQISKQHRDGFGYVFVGLKENEQKIFYFKSEKPIFESIDEIEKIKNSLKDFDNFCLSLHSRMASDGDVNKSNSHPYFFKIEDTLSFFISHNGTLNKSEIVNEYKLNNKIIESKTDTYCLGLSLKEDIKKLTKNIDELNENSLTEIYSKYMKFVKENSALNTITFFIDLENKEIDESNINGSKVNKVNAFLTNYFNGNPLSNNFNQYNDYYKIFVSKENLNYFTFISSGLYDYINEDIKNSITPIENCTFIYLENALTNRKPDFIKKN